MCATNEPGRSELAIDGDSGAGSLGEVRGVERARSDGLGELIAEGGVGAQQKVGRWRKCRAGELEAGHRLPASCDVAAERIKESVHENTRR